MRKTGEKAKKSGDIISVSNLPDEFMINDPKEYIRRMRTTYLRKVRDSLKLSIKDVERATKIKEKEINRIESGKVSEQDMMALSKICEFYGIDYPSILFMFKLARRPERQKVEKMAAYHDQKIDEETQQELVQFISKLKDSIE